MSVEKSVIETLVAFSGDYYKRGGSVLLEDSLIHDFELNSLQLFELFTAIERNFLISLEGETENIETVGELVELVEQKIEERAERKAFYNKIADPTPVTLTFERPFHPATGDPNVLSPGNAGRRYSSIVPPPPPASIEEQVIYIIASHTSNWSDTIRPQTRFKKDLGLDSAQMASLYERVQKYFQITLAGNPNDLEWVAELVDLVKAGLPASVATSGSEPDVDRSFEGWTPVDAAVEPITLTIPRPLYDVDAERDLMDCLARVMDEFVEITTADERNRATAWLAWRYRAGAEAPGGIDPRKAEQARKLCEENGILAARRYGWHRDDDPDAVNRG